MFLKFSLISAQLLREMWPCVQSTDCVCRINNLANITMCKCSYDVKRFVFQINILQEFCVYMINE